MVLMSKGEQEAYKSGEKDYESAKEKLSAKFFKFKEYEEMYLSHLKNSSNAWKSSIFDPEIFEKVERMTSHLVSTSPRGTFLPQEDSDTFNVAIANQLYKYQWDDPKAEMYKKMTDMVKMAGIYGISFGYLCWMWDRREQDVMDEKSKTKFVQLWNGPFFKPLDPRDVFPDPSGTDMHSLEWIIINQYYTMAELEGQNAKYRNGEKRFKNLGILKEKLKSKKDVVASRDIAASTLDSVSGRKGGMGVKDRILVRTRFARNRWVSWCPDYKILIEDHANPYDHFDLPIHIYIDQNVPGQLYGMGEIEPIMPLQKGLNSVLNQRLDNVRLIMNGMFKVKAGSAYAYTWKSEPGAKWVVDNVDDIQPFSIPDVTANTFLQTTSYFKDSMSRALGHTDVLTRAVSNGGPKTATELQLASGEQNARLRTKENFLDQFIKRLSTQWMQLDQQFMDEKTIVRIVGAEALQALSMDKGMYEQDENGEVVLSDPSNPQSEPSLKSIVYKGKDRDKLSIDDSKTFGFMVVEPEDIAGHFDFIVESGGALRANEQARMQNITQAVSMVTNSQQQLAAEGKSANIAPLLRIALSTLIPEIKDPDAIIKDLPPQDPAMLQQGSPTSNSYMQSNGSVPQF